MSDPNEISLAYSVDADDAFMFHALRAGAIDTGSFHFTHRRDHTAALNKLAIDAGADVVAVSVGVYPAIADRYQMLPHGASVGRGFGPVVVARRPLVPGDLAVRRDLRRARERRGGRGAGDPRRPAAVSRTGPASGRRHR